MATPTEGRSVPLSRSKHTPGPWSAHGWDVCRTSSMVKVATVEFSSDANLIAAAPEMLEALEELLSEFDRLAHECEIDSAIASDLSEIARAAIAKAKGGAA